MLFMNKFLAVAIIVVAESIGFSQQAPKAKLDLLSHAVLAASSSEVLPVNAIHMPLEKLRDLAAARGFDVTVSGSAMFLIDPKLTTPTDVDANNLLATTAKMQNTGTTAVLDMSTMTSAEKVAFRSVLRRSPMPQKYCATWLSQDNLKVVVCSVTTIDISSQGQTVRVRLGESNALWAKDASNNRIDTNQARSTSLDALNSESDRDGLKTVISFSTDLSTKDRLRDIDHLTKRMTEVAKQREIEARKKSFSWFRSWLKSLNAGEPWDGSYDVKFGDLTPQVQDGLKGDMMKSAMEKGMTSAAATAFVKSSTVSVKKSTISYSIYWNRDGQPFISSFVDYGP